MKLYIDTSCDYIQLALFDATKSSPLCTLKLLAGKKMSETILPLLDSLIKKSNIDKKSIKEIIACTGPGSFTGVRIGIALAQGLAAGLGIEAKGISTLDIMASFKHFIEGCDNFKVASLINGKAYATKSYSFAKHNFSTYTVEDEVSEGSFIASYPVLPNILDILPFDIPNEFFSLCTPLYLMKPQAELDALCK